MSDWYTEYKESYDDNGEWYYITCNTNTLYPYNNTPLIKYIDFHQEPNDNSSGYKVDSELDEDDDPLDEVIMDLSQMECSDINIQKKSSEDSMELDDDI